MEYMIQFVDKTYKRVSQRVGEAALVSLAAGRPIIIGNNGYGAHYISAIKPFRRWVIENVEGARAKGGIFCKFGVLHPAEDGCGCKDAGMTVLFDRQDLEEIEAPQERKQIGFTKVSDIVA